MLGTFALVLAKQRGAGVPHWKHWDRYRHRLSNHWGLKKIISTGSINNKHNLLAKKGSPLMRFPGGVKNSAVDI